MRVERRYQSIGKTNEELDKMLESLRSSIKGEQTGDAQQ
jgi:hypothetical protein